MTKFRFRCSVCNALVNGRNVRRHARRLHDDIVPKSFHRNARRTLKTIRRRHGESGWVDVVGVGVVESWVLFRRKNPRLLGGSF